MDSGSTLTTRVSERVMVNVDSPPARWAGALVMVGAIGWLTVLLAHDPGAAGGHIAGRLAWSLSLPVAVILVARGSLLGRPLTVGHAVVAAMMLSVGSGAHLLGLHLFGGGLTVGAGMVLMRPMPSRPDPAALSRVWTLIEATHGDPLAPFAMQSTKGHFFEPGGAAAIAYRARGGLAVVSGDPIGEPTRFAQLVNDFVAMCRNRGWRIVVLGCSEQWLDLWRHAAVIGPSLRAVPIGCDVVIDVPLFTMAGRKYRNLRQAVQRTHNAGITTEVVSEQDLDDALTAELAQMLSASHHGARVERGFSMILDHALEGRYPGIKLIIARDRRGRVQGFHRYASSGGGSDVSLDVPWRRAEAPNGIDERLTVDMIADCRQRGAQRLSLAFGAFPELFANSDRDLVHSAYHALIHLGRWLINLESLYRYLHKFHSFSQRRYVLLSMRHLPTAVVVLLSLEFMPRRRRLPPRERRGEPVPDSPATSKTSCLRTALANIAARRQ